MLQYPSPLGQDVEDVACLGAICIHDMVYSHAPNAQLFIEAGVEAALRGLLAAEHTSEAAKQYAAEALQLMGLQA